jgi:hypothetical protein
LVAETGVRSLEGLSFGDARRLGRRPSADLVGIALLWDAWLRRQKRPELTERLLPFRANTAADEAQDWLDQQN